MAWTATSPCLHYEVSGRGERALVLVHEMGGSAASWAAVVALLEDDFTILRYDQRGTGWSEKPTAAFGPGELVDDLEAVVAASGLDGPYRIAGAAAGAAVALGFALRRPADVAGVALCVPSLGVDAAQREATLARAEVARREGMAALAEPALAAIYPPAVRGDAFPAYRGRFLAHDPAAFAAHQAAFAHVELALDRVTAPCLLLAGAEDGTRPPEAVLDLVPRFADATFEVVEGAGHVMAVQAPEALAGSLRRFFAVP